MKAVVACLSVALGLGCGEGLAQDAGDITEKMRACSLLDQATRLQCLERLSREIAPAAQHPDASASSSRAPDVARWMVSETTSPLDYTPVAVATGTSDGGPDGATMQLSIRCRGGRTELVVLAPTLVGRADEHAVTYRVNGGDRVILPTGAPSSGKGLAVRGDVVRLLASLPDRGEISIQVAGRQDQMLQGNYILADLKGVLARLAAPCRWPTMARP